MAKRILPWGNAVGKASAWARSKVKVSGNAGRKSKPSPQLRGMDYPANSPADWPVEPDVTEDPPRRGNTSTHASAASMVKQNSALDAAYARTYAKPGGLKSTNP